MKRVQKRSSKRQTECICPHWKLPVRNKSVHRWPTPDMWPPPHIWQNLQSSRWWWSALLFVSTFKRYFPLFLAVKPTSFHKILRKKMSRKYEGSCGSSTSECGRGRNEIHELHRSSCSAEGDYFSLLRNVSLKWKDRNRRSTIRHQSTALSFTLELRLLMQEQWRCIE